jgi:hypothetical protein
VQNAQDAHGVSFHDSFYASAGHAVPSVTERKLSSGLDRHGISVKLDLAWRAGVPCDRPALRTTKWARWKAIPAILPWRTEAAATGRTVMPRQIITTANAPGSPLYSQGVKAGPHVLVSGIVGIVPSTGSLAGETIQEQTRQALTNCDFV